MDIIGPVSGDIKAFPDQHILVNFDGVVGGGPVLQDIRVILPPVDGTMHRARIRVSDLTADGGLGSGKALRIMGDFAPLIGGNYAQSGYVVASTGPNVGPSSNLSRRGAFIELVCIVGDPKETGWVIVAEGCQPMAPIA